MDWMLSRVFLCANSLQNFSAVGVSLQCETEQTMADCFIIPCLLSLVWVKTPSLINSAVVCQFNNIN